MAPKFARFESGQLKRVRAMQEKVYKIRITDLNKLKQDCELSGPSWIIIVITADICQWRRR